MNGYMLDALVPWMDMVRALSPFWAVRTFAGLMILTGQLLWVWNLWMTARTPKPYDYRVDLVEPDPLAVPAGAGEEA
jgi:cbb3-type cytochrome oxidase subunit 1